MSDKIQYFEVSEVSFGDTIYGFDLAILALPGETPGQAKTRLLDILHAGANALAMPLCHYGVSLAFSDRAAALGPAPEMPAPDAVVQTGEDRR